MADDPQELQERIAKLEATVDRRRELENEARTKLARAKEGLEKAEASGDRQAAKDAQEAVRKAEEELEAASARLADAEQQLDAARAALAAIVANPADSIKRLDPTQPIALLPVRIETRFAERTGGGTDLLVRIYPDDLHSDSHEPELTQTEIDWGKDFANESAKAADRDEAERAWQKLADRFGPRRASWIAEQLDPLDDQGNRTGKPASYAKRPAAWTRAARAGGLPDRWFVLGYQSGTRVLTDWCEPVVEPLATGPTPAVNPPDPGDDQLTIDDDMRWMVEFEEAVKKGMAKRIQLTPKQAQGFDLLVAVGVRWSETAAASADRLGGLLAAHRYTDGLSLVAQGTPTNDGRSDPGAAESEPYQHDSFELERGASLVSRQSDGDLVARALGLDPGALGRVAGTDGSEQLDSMAMNTAMWPATWGYYLDQLMAETFSEAAIDEGRGHFVNLVRGRGPLSALRIGTEPYGLLPVTSLDQWAPAEGGAIDVQMVSVLRALRDIWRGSIAEVPRAGRSQDPDRDLLDVLTSEPASGSFAARELLGRDYLRNLQSFLEADGIDDWWSEAEGAARAALARLGLPWDPRLVRATFAPDEYELRGALVDEFKRPSETLTLNRERNYLAVLADKRLGWQDLRSERLFNPVTGNQDDYRYRALLYLLARHSLLSEYRSAAWRILVADGLAQRAERREPELVDLNGQTRTLWRELNNPAPRTAGRTVGEYLDDPQTPGADPLATGIGRVRASLRRLARLSTASLERLLGETVDLSTHRLDAWITSYATKRLNWLRGKQASGIHLGGYGWVEDLRPAPARTPLTPPPDEAGSPLSQAPGNAGYVHAPSVAHAAAATLLRSGYLTHRGTSTGEALAIDLSSHRVRLAQGLLAGLRAGQPLGALLGYRFERGLHEGHPGLELDEYISAFRELEPLVARKQIEGGEPLQSIAANNVVDGLKLLERHRSGQIPWGTKSLPAGSGPKHDAVVSELGRVAEAVDAIADASMAESVYQLAQGNLTRSGAALNAANRGDTSPSELDVVNSARSGIGVTHRVGLLVGEESGPASGWSEEGEKRPRALAEPRLNGWAEMALGDASAVRCDAVWIDPETGEGLSAIDATPVTLDQLELCALDVLAMAADLMSAAESELDRRIARRAMEGGRPQGAPAGARVRLRYEPDPSWSKDEVPMRDFLELARSVARLVSEARPLDRRDLEDPASESGTGANLTEFRGRANDAATALEDAAADKDLDSSDRDDLDAALLQLSRFGIPGTVSVPWEPIEALQARAKAAGEEASRRLEEAATAAAEPPSGAPERARVEAQKERLRAIFGGGFRALPLFDLDAASGLPSSFADSKSLQDGDARAADRWLTKAARVRAGVGRLERMLASGQAMGTGLDPNLTVGQLPFEQSDRWLGLPVTSKHPARGGRVSFVVQKPSKLDLSAPLAGLLIDEWLETIPNASETTALAFHYDAPGAEPPQSILLAVNPDPARDWELATLEAILLETLDLARLRLVDPDSLGETGQFLPALLFSHNVAGEAVSTDFHRAAAPVTF
jgi:hypothetical protein